MSNANKPDLEVEEHVVGKNLPDIKDHVMR